MSTTTAEFDCAGRTASLSLIEGPGGVMSLGFRWSPTPPASMDMADQLAFGDGLAEALEELVPHAFDRSDDDEGELAAKLHSGGTLRKREEINTFDAASLIKAAHRAGGAPLLKLTTRSAGVKR